MRLYYAAYNEVAAKRSAPRNVPRQEGAYEEDLFGIITFPSKYIYEQMIETIYDFA